MTVNLKNIRFRLIAWYILSLGGVHLLLATGLYGMTSVRLHQELDQRLETYTTCLVELLPQHRQLDLGRVVGEMAELTALGDDLYVRVVDQDGRVIYQSADSAPEVAARLRDVAEDPADRPVTLRAPASGLWRAITRRVDDEEGRPAYVGQVAIPLREVEQTLARLRMILIWLLPCVMLLASGGAWLVLNRALSPLREVIRTAQTIQARDFSQRLRVPRTGDEIQALSETFNEMIGRLQRSFAQMRRFLSDASHELRTPLAVLKGEIELGLKAHPHADRCQEILETCSGEISRMSCLVETLLFLSHADAQEVALDVKPVSLGRLMEEMAEEARILAEPKRIHVELVNGSGALIQADEMRLKQLLLNLVGNAVKYTPEGGRIRLGCRAEHGAVELLVADTGVGIEAEHLPRIFDRFYRADQSRSRLDGGYGLGLAICRWIAEAHHGTIRVESSPGRGSVFTVRLPVSCLAEARTESEAEASSPLA